MFSFLKVFRQNVFLFFWIMELFPFGDCPTFFLFNSFKIGVTPSSFLIIKLEWSGSVRKCDDSLIFSVNECFTLSILADLLVLMKLAAEHTITTIFSTEKKRNIFLVFLFLENIVCRKRGGGYWHSQKSQEGWGSKILGKKGCYQKGRSFWKGTGKFLK